jgi:hypothetical protein
VLQALQTSSSPHIHLLSTAPAAAGAVHISQWYGDLRIAKSPGVLQDVEEPAKAMGPDALLKKVGKKQRHRDGYETNTSIMHHTASAADFVLTSEPMPLLANTSVFVLDGTESIPQTSAQDRDDKVGPPKRH